MLYILGIFVSISLILSLRLWSTTAEDLAARDFLEDQDFEMSVNSYMPQDLPSMKDWLVYDPLVDSIYELYNNLACFNADNKPDDYRWYPEDQQQDMNDPISITALGLFTKDTLKRIETQFSVRGSFDLELNECLISEFEAAELGRIFGYPIEPGMNLTFSLARNSPELGQVFIHQLELKHYYNVTIKGIYRPIPAITMLQKTYSGSFLRDSVIFLRENVDYESIIQMNINGIQPLFLIKMNIENLKADGIDQMLNKLFELADRLKINFPSSIYSILDSPTTELLQSYSVAQSAVIFVIPVVATSMILTLFTNNIVIEKRKEQIMTLKDRGALNWQIISLVVLEFQILTALGIVLAIGVSYILASFIPTIASGNFSGIIFLEFLTTMKFPFVLVLYVILGIFILTIGFTIAKLMLFLNSNKEERQIRQQEKFFRIISIVAITASTILVLVVLIILSIKHYSDTLSISNYNLYHSRKSMIIFLLVLLLIILFSVSTTFVLNFGLKKMKWFYNRMFFKNSFFISNTLKQSKSKLTSLLLIFILIGSFNVFSFNIYSTLAHNEKQESYYNNGADLRIHTSFVDSNYVINITNIEGINEAMAVLRADGKLIYNRVTVYGINPTVYSRIGRWDGIQRPHSEIMEIMNNLENAENGAIISDFVAERLSLSIGSRITVTGLPNSSYIENFYVQGIIHSAPGLGLAYGSNLELNQPNEEFLLINDYVMRKDYGVTDTNLILADLDYNCPLGAVKEDLLKLGDVIDVNPEIINPQFVGNYINQYIPNVRKFLLLQIVLMNFIGLLLITILIEFVLKQRDQNNAIMKTLGNSNWNLLQIIVSELFVIEVMSFLVSLIIGLGFTIFSININTASFTNHNIIPFQFTFAYLGITAFLIILLGISILATLPVIIRFTRKNIAMVLRG
ncbi:MAG: ABC transporter permease [Candidatus Heimdallarchaeota archaeon]|nr:ABC transporter permease [Candidatus Heimdallarchaeota archaeon]